MIELVSGLCCKISPSGLRVPSGLSPLLFSSPFANQSSLRFSFVNVGTSPNPQLPTPGGGPTSPITNGINTSAINTGKAPILAQCFSEIFTVYSAKKFPGVVESTPLSKCFATQGIKIPIRKDGPGGNDKGKKGGEEEDDF